MALKLFQVKGGLSDGNVSYLSGAGAPGNDSSYQDAAPVGSLYNNTTDGSTYKKDTAGAGTANWVKQANITDLSGLSATQSWREPAVVRDAVNTTTAAAVTEMNAADTLDGITIASGDRVLLSEVAGGAGPNVYIVGGSTGAWTLTEDTNAETAGDTLQVLDGTSANQIWFYDGTVWAWIGSQSSAEDTFLRAFIGKGAAGSEFPSYTSTNYVVNGDSLETAIGKLDAQSALNAASASGAQTSANNLQTELDATQTGAGLGTGGAYTVVGGSNYYTTATSITGALAELDTNVATAFTTTNGNVTTNAGNITNLQTEVNAIETGTGLAADGTFVTFTGTNYMGAATSITTSLTALDTQVGVNTGNITTNTGDIATINTTLGNNQTEIDAIETGSGLAADGTFVAYTGTNYLNATTTLAGAIAAVDTAAGNNATNIGTRLYTDNNYVIDAQTVTASIDALDQAIGNNLALSSAVGITNSVVDSVLVDTAKVAKWIVSVHDTVSGDDFAAEIIATHDGTSTADAVTVDWSDYAELEIGADIAGLDVSVTLTGTGTAQNLNLVVAATNAVDVTARRIYA